MAEVGEKRAATGAIELPQKKFYRARAHVNVLNDTEYNAPTTPAEYDWSQDYSEFFQRAKNAAENPSSASDTDKALDTTVRFADIGCGFGGLLVQMAPLFPHKLMVGMEIRDKVSSYVKDRITALRSQQPGEYQNIACIRTNSQRYMMNYFTKGQLEKVFFLFPDPHFKEKNHRRRIVNRQLLAEYAYVLKIGGILYTITDVKELGEWHREKLRAHPLFEEISEEELANDPAANLLDKATEEGQKVSRNGGSTHRACFRRIAGPNEK